MISSLSALVLSTSSAPLPDQGGASWNCRLIDGAGSASDFVLEAALIDNAVGNILYVWPDKSGKWRVRSRRAERVLEIRVDNEVNLKSARISYRPSEYSSKTIAVGFCGQKLEIAGDSADLTDIRDGDPAASICHAVLSNGEVGRFTYSSASLESARFEENGNLLWGGSTVDIVRGGMSSRRTPDGGFSAAGFLRSAEPESDVSGVEVVEFLPADGKGSLRIFFDKIGRWNPGLQAEAICTVAFFDEGQEL